MNKILKRKYFFLLPILILAVFIFSGNQVDKCKGYKNPYKLNIVYCIDDYKKLVAKNPNMELIDLEKSIPGVVLDIRYATNDNFTGEIIYSSAKAFARKPVSDALRKVQDSLAHHNLGLKIYDAYRPYSATVKFFEVYPDTIFVAHPKFGSRHNRGCAVDISLVDLTSKKEIAMPTKFDDFSKKAHPKYMNLPKEVIRNRTLLSSIMKHFGFKQYPHEWWHFDFWDHKNYPLTDLTFEELIYK
jgi:D-alanyl-D-alanine dipeptidase